MITGAHAQADERQQEQDKECQDLSALRGGHVRAKDQDADQNRGDRDQQKQKWTWKRHCPWLSLRDRGAVVAHISGLLRQTADVSHEVFDLVGLQAFPVGGHFAFSVGDDGG